MNITNWIPFWNSLDSVRRIHSEFELSSIIFFALLALFDALAHWSKETRREKRLGEVGVWCFFIAVFCEGVAYPYGKRNDTLSEQVIVSLSETAKLAKLYAQTALTNAGTALTNAGTANETAKTAGIIAGTAKDISSGAQSTARGARKEADSVSREVVAETNRLSHIHAFLTPRSLTPEEFKKLSKEVAPLADPNVPIVVNWSRDSGLGIQIWSALHDAGFINAVEKRDDNPEYGMSVTSPAQYELLAGELAAMLSKRGIGPRMVFTVTTPPGTPVEIYIGDIRTEPLPSLK